MDILPGKIMFRFVNLHCDQYFAPFREEYQILLGYECTFIVRFEGRVVFEDVYFPVMEFAAQLTRWFASKRRKYEDFAFKTIHDEAEKFFWMTWQDKLWEFGSDFDPFPITVKFTDEELDECVARFLAELLPELPRNAVRLLNKYKLDGSAL